MDRQTVEELEAILERHDSDLLAAHGARKGRGGDADFSQAFERLAAEVIRPNFQSACNLMKKHGVDARISVAAAAGDAAPASIALEFHVQTDAETHGFPLATPALTFSADASRQLVLIHENSLLPYIGGSAGVVGEHPISDIDESLVEHWLLDLSRKILSGAQVS